MLNSFEFFRLLVGMGISVSLQDGRLKVKPKNLLNDEIREEIKSHKAELIDTILSINESAYRQRGIKKSRISCWCCAHYDGRGPAWPGMCRYLELSGKEAKEIDFNVVDPNKGCHLSYETAHKPIAPPRMNDQRTTTKEGGDIMPTECDAQLPNCLHA